VQPELVTQLLGNRVAVSPIVTVEPRRRKFHKPILLTVPLPRSAQKGMMNEGRPELSATLHLLCSITGKRSKCQTLCIHTYFTYSLYKNVFAVDLFSIIWQTREILLLVCVCLSGGRVISA